jgi:hypothetical protein
MSRTVEVVVVVTLAVVLIQLGLVALRNRVRDHLYPPAHAAGRRPSGHPVATQADTVRVGATPNVRPTAAGPRT